MRNEQCIAIYKYRSLTGQYGRESVERAIINNELYWQSPLQFNDPFDCLPKLYFGDDGDQRKAFYTRASKKVFEGQTRASRRRHRRNMIKMPASLMEDYLKEAWQKWLRDSAVACFSEVNDHPLMWGHYADSHGGVCLAFQEVCEDDAEWFSFPVIYQSARPRVNLTEMGDPKIMKEALFLKSDHWSYELEQRMFAWNVAPGYKTFPARSLKGVILGARIKSEDEEFIRSLISKRPELDLFRAEMDPDEFKINITST